MSERAQAMARIDPGILLANATAACLRPLQALLAGPSWLFLGAMVAMLFRPPDYRFRSYDRYAFVLLGAVVFLRVLVLRDSLWIKSSIKWPMQGLLALAVGSAVLEPYDAETWSVLASKWLIPFAMFWIAAYVFRDARSLRRFELFSLIVLAYLSFIAICFMAGAVQLIVPRYILDEGLGIHADRARGPFLQAVANGVALNLLGLMALNSFRRGYLRWVLAGPLLAALPLAILATRTRAVWLSFAGTILGLLFFSPSRCLRRVCLSVLLTGLVGLSAVLATENHGQPLGERLEETSQVQFRFAVYEAGWEMFLQKPLAGWNGPAMQSELSSRISDFHQEQFYFHNTYLEILVQYGLIGLSLYAWLVFQLFRLARKPAALPAASEGFLDTQFRFLWPLFVAVYLVNGCFVVMNYQFVNGFLFAVAGMLAAQNQSSAETVVEHGG